MQQHLILLGVAGAQACQQVGQTHDMAKLWSHTTKRCIKFNPHYNRISFFLLL